MKRGRVVAVIVALGVVAAIVYMTVLRRPRVERDFVASGTVEATEASLGFGLPGRIDSIVVREGDRVHAGQELAMLDRTEVRARRAQAVAQRSAAQSLLMELRRGARSEELDQARQAALLANQKLVDAQRDSSRIERLFKGGAVSQETLDKARLAVDAAQAQKNQSDEQLRLIQAGPRPERVSAQRAAVEQADAALRQIDAMIANAVIKAPFDGIVTVRDREPGETVGAGAPVLTLTNLGDRWVRIYIREDRIGAVHLGQGAAVTSDTYPDKRYAGTVAFIASEAEFTPRNVQTTEERVKLVYAVKVRVTRDPANELKPGMPVDVRLELTAPQP